MPLYRGKRTVSLLRSTWIALSVVSWSRGSSPVSWPSPLAEPGVSLPPAKAWLTITAANAANTSVAASSQRLDKSFISCFSFRPARPGSEAATVRRSPQRNLSGCSVKSELLNEPLALKPSLFEIGVDPAGLLGDPSGDEPKARGFPELDARRRRPVCKVGCGVDQLTCARQAHPRVRLTSRLVPAVDTPHQSSARRDDLDGQRLQRVVQLDLVQRGREPVREIHEPAGVDSGATRRDVGFNPLAGAALREGPREAAEHATTISGQELVRRRHECQSLNAVSSFAFISSGISSVDSRCAVATVVRTWSTKLEQPSQKLRCSSNAVICSAVIVPSMYSDASATTS